MAYIDSPEIKPDEAYLLGEYRFDVQNVVSEGERVIQAHVTGPGGNAAHGITVPTSNRLKSWYVEANETEATVYAVVKKPVFDPDDPGSAYLDDYSGLDIENLFLPFTVYSSASCVSGSYIEDYTVTNNALILVNKALNEPFQSLIAISKESFSAKLITRNSGHVRYCSVISYSYNLKGETQNYYVSYFDGAAREFGLVPSTYSDYDINSVAYILFHGYHPYPVDYEEEEILVGRFAIEIEDAGGVGPGGGIGGGWTDPEDYDEDWEEGEPTHTLYVEVTGALSGRHNDPIEDPSYSYIPADKDTVKDYGCGGDGGHGGGGGAGASTVVIHKFATNQANSKEVTALARRHGYGSGGGKGGKGGDGCILVYY